MQQCLPINVLLVYCKLVFCLFIKEDVKFTDVVPKRVEMVNFVSLVAFDEHVVEGGALLEVKLAQVR